MAKGTRISFYRSDGTKFGSKSAAAKKHAKEVAASRRALQRFYDKKYGKRLR